LASHSTLTDEHEGSQEHPLGRYDEGQGAKRKWIEWSDSWNQVKIYQAPARNQNQLSQQKSQTAHKFCNYVAHPLTGSPATMGVMLQLGYCIDVVLRGIRCRPMRPWIFHWSTPDWSLAHTGCVSADFISASPPDCDWDISRVHLSEKLSSWPPGGLSKVVCK
jgi:hypothetical protein